MPNFYNNKNGFFSLLSVLIALIIMLFFYYFISKMYLHKPVIDSETKKIANEQGINTSNHSSLLKSVKDKMSEINKK